MTTQSVVVVVSAGLSVPSSTRLLADRLADAVSQRASSVEIIHVELRDLAHALTDHLLTGFPNPELEWALDQVRRADAVIAVTPVFSASYSGLFKTFFDVLEAGTLDGVPVLIAATAGTARHSLVLDHALRPLFSYLHAVVLPTGVFAATDDFGDTSAGALQQRVDRAAAELVAHLGTQGGPAPQERPVLADPFAAPTPFEQLLRDASQR